MKFPIKDLTLNKKGEIDLPSCFQVEDINQSVIHDAIKNELNNKRQGNAHSQTYGEVTATTKKPYKQKGTGRARAGSAKSPLWRGGGVTFGPRKRDYYYKIPRKVKQQAFFSILSMIKKEDRLSIFDDIELNEYKTSKVHQIFSSFKNAKKIILVISSQEKFKHFLQRSAGNIPYLKVFNIQSLELKDIFYADQVVFSVSAINYLNKNFLRDEVEGGVNAV